LSLADVLFPGPAWLHVTKISTDDTRITLELPAPRVTGACPSCPTRAYRVQGYDTRTVADLP